MKPLKKNALCLLALSLFFINCRNGGSRYNTNENDSINKTTPDSSSQTTINPRPDKVTIDSSNVESVLIDKIKQLQRHYVKDSWGINADQCFTDVDFQSFKNDGKISEIVAQLKEDRYFKEIILAIKKQSPQDRASILNNASETYRKTWAILGLDPQTTPEAELRKGQTEAGSKAEEFIAEAVVNLINES